MTSDLHEALRDAAAAPTRDVDVERLVSKARARNRGVVALSLVASLAIVATGIAWAARDTGGSSSLAVRAGGIDSATPDGWERIDTGGISIAIPPTWERQSLARPSVTVLVGNLNDQDGLVAFATCRPGAPTTPQAPGTWVYLSEYPPDATVIQSWGTTSEVVGPETVTPRPLDFTDPSTAGSLTECAGPGSTDGSPDAARWFYAFTDKGRVFSAHIVTTELPDRTNVDVARQILNTLQVEPLGDTETATTTTLAHASSTTTTAPSVTPTVPAETGPVSEDEAAIGTTFASLVGANPRDALDSVVEDFASIADSWREGMAQNSEEFMRRHASRADRVTITDDTHADVEWSLLLDGTSRFGTLPGGAIKIDGRWYITRDTVCNLLTYGGIICPPRS